MMSDECGMTAPGLAAAPLSAWRPTFSGVNKKFENVHRSPYTVYRGSLNGTRYTVNGTRNTNHASSSSPDALRSTLYSLIILIALLVTVVSPANAAVWYVNDASTSGDSYTFRAGNDGYSGNNPDSPKLTIYAAMTLAVSGDTILIDAGTYLESVSVTADSISLSGKDSTISGTIIDGVNYGPDVIKLLNRTGVRVSKIRAQRGNAAFNLNNGGNNVVSNCYAINNSLVGIQVTGAISNCIIQDNVVETSGNGINVQAGTGHIVKHNMFRYNNNIGIAMTSGATNCVITQNEVDSNNIQLWLQVSTDANNISKNNFILGNGGTQIQGWQTNGYYLKNWWGTRDSSSIAANFNSTNVVFIPYRLGPVDTAVGADTVAPRAPDTVAAAGLSYTSIRVRWSPTVNDEENDSYATNLAGYKIYRSATADTSYWALRGYAGSSELSYDDTGLTYGDTWYYKVTAYDNWPNYPNESWYDTNSSLVSGASTVTIDTSGANVWYVNDGATVGDSYTTAVGSDANNGLTSSTPKRYIQTVMGLLTPGDTVYVDAGTYAETFAIVVDSASVIGKDSSNSGTIINLNDTVSAFKTALYATGCTNLLVQSLRIQNVTNGVHASGISQARFLDIHIEGTGDNGGNGAIRLDACAYVRIANCVIESCATNGISFTGNSTMATVTGNRIRGNAYSAINLGNGTTLCSISENVVERNGSRGIMFQSGTSGNRVTGGHIFDHNRMDGNGWGSIYSTGNGNEISQVQIDSGAWWIVYIDAGISSPDTFRKNNFNPSPSALRIDSGVYNGSFVRLSFERNWWNTVDSAAIRSRIWGPGRDSVVYIPYRLGPVDTASGADTVAPRAPDTVAATALSSSSIRIAWGTVTQDEENDSYSTNATTYKVYKSKTSDTSVWQYDGQVSAPTESYTVTGLDTNTAYYFKVTCSDNWPNYPNESWYSDSTATATTSAGGGESVPPAAFSLLTPTTLTETNVRTVTLSWQAATDSSNVTYRVIVDTMGHPSMAVDSWHIINADTNSTSISIAIPMYYYYPSFSGADTYYWCVKATDSWGNVRWSTETFTLVIDTVPPTQPTALLPANGIDTTNSFIYFSWTSSTDSCSGLNGYRLQIDTNGTFINLSNQIMITGDITTGTTNINYNDTYYWRVVAYDDAGNTSAMSTRWFRYSGYVDTSGANVWYVNDTSLTSDSYTTAIGADSQSGLYSYAPKRTISAVMSLVTAGDTVYVDAGTFTETVVINANNVALIGKDSNSTIIDPPGANNTVGLYGIFADTQTNLSISNLCVTGAYDGIRFENVDTSTLSSVSTSANGDYGIYLLTNSDSTTITGCASSSNTLAGMYVVGSNRNTIVNNTVTSNSGNGIHLNSNSCTSTITGNTVSSNAYGIYLSNGSNSNVISLNSAISNTYGLYLFSSSNNTVCTNACNSNSNHGAYISTNSDSNMLFANTFNSNSMNGIFLITSANRNSIWNNSIAINGTYGLIINSSSRNYFSQNNFESNTEWQVYLLGTSTGDTFFKNNVRTAVAKADSGILNATAATYDFTRNSWNRAGAGVTNDSSVIRTMITENGGGMVTFAPFRLGYVDTRLMEDTIAPDAPDTVSATALSASSVQVTWSRTLQNEESSSWYTNDTAGYRIYRSTSPYPNQWTLVKDSGVSGAFYNNPNSYTDTGLSASTTYYYKVTVYDNRSPYANECWYSDSTASATTQATPGESVPPAAFSLSLPINGTETNVRTVYLYWATATDSSNVTYRVVVDSNLAYSAGQILDTTVTSPLMVFTPALLPGHPLNNGHDTYYWRVRATDSWSNVRWSTETFTLVVDTRPPTAPTGVQPANGMETTQTTILFGWSVSVDSFTGINSYRLQIDTQNTFVSLLVDSLCGLSTSGTRSFTTNDTYYWRVIAYDDAGNTSAMSPWSFKVSGYVDTTGPNVWYVNDTSTTGDSYTYAVGSDANNGTSRSTPKRTLNSLEGLMSAGDTIYMDAGYYYENDSFTITQNGVYLIGKDSLSTVIRFDTYAYYRSIFAANRTNLTFRDFRVGYGYRGIYWINVDTSVIEQVFVDSALSYGIGLETGYGSGSDSNMLRHNTIRVSSDGMYIISSGNSTIEGNDISGGNRGIYITSNNNVLTNNTCSGHASTGIYISGQGNSLISNISRGNALSGSYNHGIYVSGSNNILTGNQSFDNNGTGIYVNGSSNILTSNISSWNMSTGICVFSDSNTFISNVTSYNRAVGMVLSGASNNNVKSNLSANNDSAGFRVGDFSSYPSSRNLFIQNVADSNGSWAFQIVNYGVASASDTFEKNIIVTSIYKPDSGISNEPDSGLTGVTLNRFDMKRNYWKRGGIATIDTTIIRGMISNTGADSVAYTPYRLGTVDTTLNADTVAPDAPDTVGASALSASSIRVFWMPVTLDEENDSYATNLTQYRVYRSRTADTSYWAFAGAAAAGTLTFDDSGLVAASPYYYRVTSVDNWSIENQSWFSDSIAFATTLGTNSSGSNPVSIIINDSITPVITDTDENQNSGTIETVIVTITNTVTGETEILVLFETDSNSGIFDVTHMPVTQNLSDSLSRSDTLMVRSGDTVTIRYVDNDDATDSWTSTGTRPTVASSTSSGTFTDSVTVTKPIVPSITDLDENRNGRAIDTIAVYVTNLTTGESEIVILYETDSNSGIFDVTQLPTSRRASDSGNNSGTLYLRGGDTVRIRYIDPNDPADSISGSFPAGDTISGPTLLTPSYKAETSVSTVSFSWSSGSTGLAVSYRLQVSADASFSAPTLDTVYSSATATQSIPANSRYVWRVIALSGSSRETSSLGYFTIDTSAPSTPTLDTPANAATITTLSTQFKWLAASDSAPSNSALYSGGGPRVSSYRIAVSRNAGFTDTVINETTSDTTTTPAYGWTSGQTYYWRVQAVDLSGNASSWSTSRSFTQNAAPDTSTPFGPQDLISLALDTGSIRIAWTSSPSASMDSGGYYRLLWNNGAGNPTTLIETVAHAGVNGTYSYLTGILTSGTTYTFEVEAVSRHGIADTYDARTWATANTVTNVPFLQFINPKAGEDANRGGNDQVLVNVGPLDRQDPAVQNLAKIKLEYQRAGTNTWTAMTPVATNQNKYQNPLDYHQNGNGNGKPVGEEEFLWDVAGLPNDTYYLRAIPIMWSGVSYPEKATVILSYLEPQGANSKYQANLNTTTNEMTLQTQLDGSSDTVSASLPTNQNANVKIDSTDIPLDANGVAPKLVLVLSEAKPADSSLASDSIVAAGAVVDVSFSNGQQPKNEVVIEITLPPSASNGRVWVGNKKVKITDLKVYRHNGSAWTEVTTFEVDTSAWVIRIRSSHFSLFRAAAAETSLITGLTAPTPDSPGTTSRSRTLAQSFRWQAATDEDTTQIRYKVQFSTTSEFAAIAYETTGVRETGAAVNLPANVRYYWRVMSENISSGDTQISSGTRMVIIDTAPPVLGAITFPYDTYGKIARRNSRFQWASASDSDAVDTFRLKVWGADTSVAAFVDSSLTSSQLSATLAALTPGTYWWRLFVGDLLGNETGTAFRQLTVYKNGDVTEDGAKNAEDYFSFGRRFGAPQSTMPLADLDLDGDIDSEDLRIMMNEE